MAGSSAAERVLTTRELNRAVLARQGLLEPVDATIPRCSPPWAGCRLSEEHRPKIFHVRNPHSTRDPAAPTGRIGCMNRIHVTLTAAAAAVIAAAGIALASGGPPPVQPADPAVDTVVSTATAQAAVVAPARRSNATIERAVRGARARALPDAVAAARAEAAALAAAAGLRAGSIVAVRRDSSPLGYWDQDSGRFGPGVWCGRVYDGRRIVRRADGTTRRVSRFHRGCPVPKTASIRVTLTFAARQR